MYEYSRRLTIGGPNGTYQVQSPWNGPCEWAVTAVCFTGAGGVSITDIDIPAGGVPVTATTSFTDPYPGMALNVSAATTLVPDAIFTPLPGNRLTIVASGLTTASALVTVVFRRPAVIETTFPALIHTSEDDEARHHQLLAANAEADLERVQDEQYKQPAAPAVNRREVMPRG